MAAPDAFSSRAVLAGWQEEQLRLLLDAILPGNRFYAQKFAAAGLARGDMRTPDDLRRLPFTTKAELALDHQTHPPYGSVLTYPPAQYTRMHHTSGTRGTPLRWLDTPASWDRLMRCWRQMYDIAGLDPGRDRLCFAFSFGPFLGFWSAFEGAAAFRRYAMGGMSTLARLRFLIDNEATVLLCTPTYALHLAEVAKQHGIVLAPSTPGYRLRALLVAGEIGGSIPATRARLENAWQARVYDHYGLTEVGPISIECPHAPSGLHILEGDYLIEVIEPATGKPAADDALGELVITTLGRLGSPVLRYRTGDLVRVDPNPCPCRRTFRRLAGGVLGRSDDMIAVRGNNLYPGALEDVIRRFPEVTEFRVEIDTTAPLTEVRIEIEPEAGLPPAGFAALGEAVSQTIRETLLFRAEVIVVTPGTLPRFEMKAQRIRKK